MRGWIRTAGLLAATLFAFACGESDRAGEAEEQETRQIMGIFFENLRILLPQTVQDDGLDGLEPRAGTRDVLAGLADNASVLEAHVQKRNGGTHDLARSLERDTSEILAEYERGHFDRAGYLLQQVTENCVVCHSRLPSPGDSHLSEDFLSASELTNLGPHERATLQIATRRFDDALETLEQALSSDEHAALMLGPLTDYLTLSIRVKDDYDRPVPILQRFAEREDTWERMRLDVEAWTAALPEMQRRTRGEPQLATAREILSDGTAFGSVNDPREGLVHLIAASALLQRAVDSGDLEGVDLAEAYYLLGMTEARIGRNYWLTQAPHFLEGAIRLAPGAPFARAAYALLEEELLMLYEGTDWERVPEDDAGRLAELRQMIEETEPAWQTRESER